MSGRIRTLEQWITRFRSQPGWLQTATALTPVIVVATLLRMVDLAGSPSGFRPAEAGSALFARIIGPDRTPIFFTGAERADEPLFFYLVRLTGDLAGWDVDGPRLTAALCGIVATIGCALWFRSALGRPWAIAGGLLVATSFWQLMLSRQAIEPAMTVMIAALALWCIWEATNREHERRAAIWFLAAGVVFGLGFYADIALRLVPLAVPAIGGFLLWIHRRDGASTSGRGVALMIGTMLAVALPLISFYVDSPDDFRRGFELAGGFPESLPVAGWNYGVTLQSFVWDGSESTVLNLPGRPLLDPVLAVWTVTGLAVALRHPLRPLHGLALLWTAMFLLPAALLAPEDPGLLLPVTPAVFLFPLIGMRAALQWLERHSRRAALIGLAVIVLSIAGSAGWSLTDYFWRWSESEETYLAFNGDVRESLAAVKELPNPGLPVYYLAGDDELIVRYLAGDRPLREISRPSSIPVPSTGSAYLIYPVSNAPGPELFDYIEEQPLVRSGRTIDGEAAYQARLLDVRVRERLPYVVPAISFNNGYTLLGYQISATPGSEPDSATVDIVLVWELPADGDPYTLSLRLQPPGEPANVTTESAGTVLAPAGGGPAGGRDIMLVHLRMPFPPSEERIADLQTALLKPDGSPVRPVEETIDGGGGYIVLNRIALESAGS